MKVLLLLVIAIFAVQAAHIPFEDDEVIQQLQDFLIDGSEDEEVADEEFDHVGANTTEQATTEPPATTEEPITAGLKKPSKEMIILQMIMRSFRRLSFGQRHVAYKMKGLYKQLYGDFHINTRIAQKLMRADRRMKSRFARHFYRMMKKRLEEGHDDEI